MPARMQRDARRALSASPWSDLPGARPACWSEPGASKPICLYPITADRGSCRRFQQQRIGRATRDPCPSTGRSRRQNRQVAHGRPQRPRLPEAWRVRGPDAAGRRLLRRSSKSIEFTRMSEDACRIRITAHARTRASSTFALVVYNRFQFPSCRRSLPRRRLIPAPLPDSAGCQPDSPQTPRDLRVRAGRRDAFSRAFCLQNLADTNLSCALLESAAGEHGARMSSMDSATRNAGKMIQRLTLELQSHAPG